MTNLDSLLKSRNITLLAKVCLVKAIVFPVVMYGCESWTIKTAECQSIDAFDTDEKQGKKEWTPLSISHVSFNILVSSLGEEVHCDI